MENNLFLARQPIFDKKQRVWGYEMLYRPSSEAESAGIEDQEESTLKVAASLLLSPDNGYQGARSILNCSRDFLLHGYAKGLASNELVLSVPQELLEEPALQQAIKEIHEAGATLSLAADGSGEAPPCGLDCFRLVELPFPYLQQAQNWPWLHDRNQAQTRLLVNRIETHEELDAAFLADASLFQGFYFQRPRTYTLKPLSVSVINRFKILQILESDEKDIRSLTEAVRGEVSIAVRLLKLVNSPAFGFIREIESVHQAITLAGWDRIKSWLRLVIVSDMPPTDKSQELAYASAVNAKFLELLALYSRRMDIADKLYLCGLLSLLEPMFDKAYHDIFKECHLNKDVENALTGEGGELLPWLTFVRQLDSGNWLHLDAHALQLGVTLKSVSKAKLDALAWANEFFSAMR